MENEYLTLIKEERRNTGSYSHFHEAHALETWVILETSEGKQIESNIKDIMLEKEIHDENYPEHKHWKKMYIYRTGDYLFISKNKIT
jgi:hypothetical protein